MGCVAAVSVERTRARARGEGPVWTASAGARHLPICRARGTHPQPSFLVPLTHRYFNTLYFLSNIFYKRMLLASSKI